MILKAPLAMKVALGENPKKAYKARNQAPTTRMATAAILREFLQNSLNVSETSRNLFMHRNTLMYRLDKIERMTGLNLRKFSDAVTFRLITILGKLV